MSDKCAPHDLVTLAEQWEGQASDLVREMGRSSVSVEEATANPLVADALKEAASDLRAALRAHRCAPAVEVATTWTPGPWLMPDECLDEACAARSVSHRHSTPTAPSAEGEADDATRGRAAKLPADRADDVEIALRAAMAWWEDPSDEPGSPRRVAIELADEVRRLRGASPAVEIEDATQHGMVPGSHERPDGPECTCGRPWSRWDDACGAGDPS